MTDSVVIWLIIAAMFGMPIVWNFIREIQIQKNRQAEFEEYRRIQDQLWQDQLRTLNRYFRNRNSECKVNWKKEGF